MKLSLFNNRLGFRLVLLSLLIGSVLSVFSTGIQLLASYERQKGDATAVFDQIKDTLHDALEFALWTFDLDQIEIILDGLAANENIAHVQLVSETGQIWERGTSIPKPVVQVFELIHVKADKSEQKVGTLQVSISLENVDSRIWQQFWVSFLTNLTKAYLAAMALLYVVHRLVTRHLAKIAGHVDATNVAQGAPALQLDRPPGHRPDDLDSIVTAIQGFEKRAANSMEQMQEEVKERIKSEQEAREALSVRSSFISTMSHEVRTPLNSILGFLHLIKIADDVPDKQRNYAHVAIKAAQQLHNQLTNVLEMSRLDSNAVMITTRPTDIRRLADQWQATAEAAVHYHDKTIAVTLDLDEGLDEEYMVDGARLTQIVTNLTDNAAKFTSEGEICIGIRRVPQTHEGQHTHGLEISVADTGAGIEDAQRARVFDRFAQSDTGLMRAHGGSGLGLSVSNEVSALMGAKLSLDAVKKDGFATRFLITLGCTVRLEHHDD